MYVSRPFFFVLYVVHSSFCLLLILMNFRDFTASTMFYVFPYHKPLALKVRLMPAPSPLYAPSFLFIFHQLISIYSAFSCYF